MAVWELKPFHSVGPLVFGESRNTARVKVNSPFVEFLKAKKEVTTDAFDDIALHLHYDKNDKLTSVDAAPPCDLRYNDIKFIDRTVAEVVEDLQDAGFVCDDNLIVEKLGIAIYGPMKKVEAVPAFSAERFAEYNKLMKETPKRREELRNQDYPPIPFGPQAESMDWEE